MTPWGDILKIVDVKTNQKIANQPYHYGMSDIERTEKRKCSKEMDSPYEIVKFVQAERLKSEQLS